MINKIKKLFYWYLFRNLFVTKALNLNIFAVNFIDKTNSLPILGGVLGGAVGASVQPQISFVTIPLGTAIGTYIGKVADDQLYRVQDALKQLKIKNQNSVNNNIELQNSLSLFVKKFLEKIVKIIENNLQQIRSFQELQQVSFVKKELLKETKELNVEDDFIVSMFEDDNISKQIAKMIQALTT